MVTTTIELNETKRGVRMIDEMKEYVHFGEKLGADFVEVRYEDLTLRTLERTDDIWKEMRVMTRKGYAITCYVEGVSGFSFSASTEPSAIKDATTSAYKMAKASAAAALLKLPFEGRDPIKSKTSDTRSYKLHSKEVELEEKAELVNRIVETAKAHGENIRNIIGRFGELYGQKLFTSSDNDEIEWEFNVVDLGTTVTSQTTAGDLVTGSGSHGGSFGLEVYKIDEYTPEHLGKKAADFAKEQLKAKSCPPGKHRALIDEKLVGVLAHESFGHLSESDFVIMGASPLSGKIGVKMGTEKVTIVDKGRVDVDKFGGIWIPYDDQGTPSKGTVIMKEGVVKHYLHNRGTAKKLEQSPTGNARAVNFSFPAIPRMTNTYVEPGDLKSEEEAIEQLGTGVYARETTGGQVELDGGFLFISRGGYWVENCEIKYPIKSVALSGNILELLGKVEAATNELKIIGGYFGGCGKGEQYPLPNGIGGPKLVIEEVTFGGQE